MERLSEGNHAETAEARWQCLGPLLYPVCVVDVLLVRSSTGLVEHAAVGI
jgi:hypothetical protein